MKGLKSSFRNRNRFADFAYFGRILDRTQLFDGIPARFPGHPGHELAQDLPIADRQMTRLETDRAESEFLQDVGRGLVEGLRRRANMHFKPGTLFRDLLREPGITEEELAISTQKQEAAFAAESREISHVDRIADQQRFQLLVR